MPVLFLTDLTDVKIVNQNRRKIAKMEPCILKNWELFDLKNLTLKQIFATIATFITELIVLNIKISCLKQRFKELKKILRH